jgi:hypothetical protein
MRVCRSPSGASIRLDHPGEEVEVRVRVVEAGAGSADQRPCEGDVQQLLRGPLPEGVAVELGDEGGVLLDPVGIAGGRAGEHPQGHPTGVRQTGEPLGDRVVERQPPLILELEDEVDDVGDRDRADAEVHPRVRRHAGHRFARCGGGERAVADVDAQQRRAKVLLGHRPPHDPLDLATCGGEARAPRRGAGLPCAAAAPVTGRRCRCRGRQRHGDRDGDRHPRPPESSAKARP